ncbi:hypothetical protein [Nocardia salmonicida]|uniref:hypothetical protein n=1 Tax=Nocardia salmonicida TaxID=53431 RepID=UPI0037A24F19
MVATTMGTDGAHESGDVDVDSDMHGRAGQDRDVVDRLGADACDLAQSAARLLFAVTPS